jgi:8-oxo-dGTP pyrophosphatase MutT (NUDIX family)
LEGPNWDCGKLDLLDCSEAAKRYSMKISITGLLLTSDERFVLQRRSDRVLSGSGNLGAAVAGSVDYHRDVKAPGYLPRIVWERFPELLGRWSLEQTVLREIREEIGVTRSDCSFPNSGPFIGAAFNLRYGRDLNFYSIATTAMASYEIGETHQDRIKHGWSPWKGARLRDKWEVDRLEFLDARNVTTRSTVDGNLARMLGGASRHLLGALYSWAVYKGR